MRPCLGGLVIPYTCNSWSRYTLSLKVPRMLSLKTKDRTGGGGGVQGVGGYWGITPPTAFFVRNKKKVCQKLLVTFMLENDWKISL